jgi:response regulator RpfG family c-di-GMP phosphodiesterase
VHYAIATVLMVFYGTQVCPYIDSLPLGEVTASFAVAMLLALVVRNRIVAGWAEDRGFLRRLLRLDCAVLVCAAVAIGTFNMLAHQFPLGSGFKVLFGISGLGLFIVVDTAISEATRIMKLRDDRGESIDSDSPYVPLVGRFVGVVTIGVVVMAGIMVMLIYKDFEWLQQLSDANRAQANLAVLIEFTLVAIVFLAYLIKVMANYGRQLNWLLQRERNVLAAVGQGRLKTRIPAISHDELGEIAQLTNRMIEQLEHQNREIKTTQEVTILSLASLAETRDNETGAHILRTQRYVKLLALEMRKLPAYAEELTDEVVELLFQSAPLHDVGKVGIPDSILLKPGKLNDREFEIMKTHAQLGAEALRAGERQYGSSGFLVYACEIAAWHHEKWDGTGYPDGLATTEIPLSARLMALADVYDALRSKRVYKEAFSHEKSRTIIVDGRGSHFDPDVVDAFIAVEDEFFRVANTYLDNDENPLCARRAD